MVDGVIMVIGGRATVVMVGIAGSTFFG